VFSALQEVVADKGYRSNEVVFGLDKLELRTYIAERGLDRLVPFDPNETLGGAVRLDSTQRPGIICRGNHQRPRWRLLCVIE